MKGQRLGSMSNGCSRKSKHIYVYQVIIDYLPFLRYMENKVLVTIIIQNDLTITSTPLY